MPGHTVSDPARTTCPIRRDRHPCRPSHGEGAGPRVPLEADAGRYASISEIVTAETIDRGYVGSILRLTLLSPEIVEAILDGQQPVGLALSDLLKPFPLQWGRQRAAWAITRGIR